MYTSVLTVPSGTYPLEQMAYHRGTSVRNWTREYHKDYWMERSEQDNTVDNRPVSCKLVCAYGTYNGRVCIKDPLNCIDIQHEGRWHCVLRTYAGGNRTIQVLPL